MQCQPCSISFIQNRGKWRSVARRPEIPVRPTKPKIGGFATAVQRKHRTQPGGAAYLKTQMGTGIAAGPHNRSLLAFLPGSLSLRPFHRFQTAVRSTKLLGCSHDPACAEFGRSSGTRFPSGLPWSPLPDSLAAFRMVHRPFGLECALIFPLSGAAPAGWVLAHCLRTAIRENGQIGFGASSRGLRHRVGSKLLGSSPTGDRTAFRCPADRSGLRHGDPHRSDKSVEFQ